MVKVLVVTDVVKLGMRWSCLQFYFCWGLRLACLEMMTGLPAYLGSAGVGTGYDSLNGDIHQHYWDNEGN